MKMMLEKQKATKDTKTKWPLISVTRNILIVITKINSHDASHFDALSQITEFIKNKYIT